jgi:hypothetical protein
MLLPALIFIGIMGMFLYLLDNQYGQPSKKQLHSNVKANKEDHVSFMPAIYDEQVKAIEN